MSEVLNWWTEKLLRGAEGKGGPFRWEDTNEQTLVEAHVGHVLATACDPIWLEDLVLGHREEVRRAGAVVLERP